MKYLVQIVFFIFVWGCDSAPSFEKDYYELITKIKFPDQFNTITTSDNGEFLTITILELRKEDCKKFIVENNFQPVDQTHVSYLMGLNQLDSAYQKLPDNKTLFERAVNKIPGKTGWTYLIDTTTCRLYCEIDYPDRGGN